MDKYVKWGNVSRDTSPMMGEVSLEIYLSVLVFARFYNFPFFAYFRLCREL